MFIKSKKEYKKLIASLNEYTVLEGIKQWINGQDIADELIHLCEDFIASSKGNTFVVRSSSDCEDSSDKSYAGMFASVLNIKTAKEMAEAIRTVFVSKYSYLIDDPDDLFMGIILQEQVKADYSGVAFSVNPLTGEDEILINFTKGDCEEVVSGNESYELTLDKLGNVVVSDNLPKDIQKIIVENIIKIENMYEHPIDVEWAVCNGVMYILQVRKVTSVNVKEKVVGKNMYIDSLDIDELENYDMSAIMNSHRKYMEKHFMIRKKAFEFGLKFPEVGYLFYNRELLDEKAFEELVPKSTIYKVSTEEQIRTLAKEDVVPYLKSLGENADNIARIQRITMTNACGNSSLTDEGNIFIEYMPGGFGGFISGELPFSNYIVDKSGKGIYSDEKVYSAKWEFDDGEKKFVRKEQSPEKYVLSDSVINQLVEISEKIKTAFENPRVEWEIEDDTVYLNDISFEKSKVADEALISRCLSNGIIDGEIRVIDNLADVKKVIRNRSIVAESDFYKAQKSNELKQLLEKYNIEQGKKYVFVSESAHPSLSILMKYSSGFIFEKGGMLSHLAIVLRENGIPGIIEEGAMLKYETGMNYKGDKHSGKVEKI